MHAVKKILAGHSGKRSVQTGEIVTAKVDFAEINDLYLQTVYSFYEMGGEQVWDPEKCAFVFDHYAPHPGCEERGQPPADAGICQEKPPEIPF